jgi:hypothetical protein
MTDPPLAPISGPLGEDDLCMVITSDELAAIVTACHALGIEFATMRLVHRHGSPWIEIGMIEHDRKARVWTETMTMPGVASVRKLALWRYTLAVYLLEDGAVVEGPIWEPT